VMAMRFDGSFGRAELTCDLFVHLSSHHSVKDLSLATARWLTNVRRTSSC
jgi:hypothetical protein